MTVVGDVNNSKISIKFSNIVRTANITSKKLIFKMDSEGFSFLASPMHIVSNFIAIPVDNWVLKINSLQICLLKI